MSNQKICGVPGHLMSDSIFGAGVNHLEYIRSFGAVPRILGPEEDIIKELDLLYLPGGPDLNPWNYREAPGFKVRYADVHNEWFLKERLPGYIENKTPIFGVCLGMQSLQVAFGGKLLQHLLYHPSSDARWQTAHPVWDVNTHESHEVNSHHHQGIKEVAEGFEIDLVYSALKDPFKNGKLRFQIVEAMHHKELPIACCQFHPEELIHEKYSERAIKALLGGKKNVEAL